MTTRASGPFDVKMNPQADEQAGAAALARMTLDKQYHGDLEATGQGQMLAAGGAIPTSGAYVAVERVTGTLAGRKGSFALVHRGIRTSSSQELSITVVPDSGTGELAGLSGQMGIEIAADGKHSYVLEYTLPTAR
ncbi:MAG TPA: DUF3224 domain-containing protein [Thermoanaerobaculia bacterium]|nr:DUF3224 domain-containing protein [Thermoanaerobaculia bacterium]